MATIYLKKNRDLWSCTLWNLCTTTQNQQFCHVWPSGYSRRRWPHGDPI